MNGETVGDAAVYMAEGDNVVTALDDLDAGRQFWIGGEPVRLVEDIDAGHEFALVSIDAGETVRKDGEGVGTATAPIEPGEWVHSHNADRTRDRPSAEAAVDEEA
ncbi:dehydratase [Halosimplex carlsbadense 2-9-1]|uniref:Dehydratase n=1 Tax=Halosimplex carlsbadense 2-9-1 TaxID=797114 RepID=M0CC78_9EURY|nr:UxaA family hydrolase [Halosimplex carlsbadense]ELZ19952.1 dehydratase [Halosimplex carlsbadense 2-9-1]